MAALKLVKTTLIAPGPRSINNVTFNVNALTYTYAAILINMQIMLLNNLAQLYGTTKNLSQQPLPR